MSDQAHEKVIDLDSEPEVEMKVPCRGTLCVQYVSEGTPPVKPSSVSGEPPSASGGPGSTRLPAMPRAELRKWMNRCFSLEELKVAIWDLEIDTETFAWSTKSATIRDIIDYCDRHGRYEDLLTRLAEGREKALTPED